MTRVIIPQQVDNPRLSCVVSLHNVAPREVLREQGSILPLLMVSGSEERTEF